ncbi:Gfo/Idh/MocA family protein [Halogeometricum limi]|uniref:Predicted dehydrogenase n=1 Tax=Halogeometricum limi TaxID=555875 RepID=A0A1I6IBA9_9EURY|nr:Gfo/Idh/MocA family oxidoreductase [Halogeometricum limi]SFR64095.1 Predicted dehydrogenase [Halogeometricum limi]
MTLAVGFIGAGGIASVHLATLDEASEDGLRDRDGGRLDVELVGVADVDESRAREAAEPRGAAAYTDGVDLLESESLDAVVVAVPPFAHGEYERVAAERDVALFVEKPLGLDADAVRETAQVVEDAGVLTHVGYVCRYAQITERARELLDGRTMGHVDSTYWVPLPDTPWWRERARSGGQLVEQSTHVYDLHRYLLGDATAAIGSGTDRRLVDAVDFQDTTSVTLEHDSGAVSHVSSSCASPESRFRVRINAEDAFLELDYFEHTLTGTVDGETVAFEGDGGWYRREFEAFLRAAAAENAREAGSGDADDGVRSDFGDALKTLELTLDARRAAESGGRVSSR